MFDRNLGESSPLKLPRGKNDLWTRGGLMYVPPIR
jgi:general L-amino acid transport system substrate-binding protein